ncbi:probable LRR receptor-like serine/threonine-protein kinase At1g29720 [Fagus crenata]
MTAVVGMLEGRTVVDELARGPSVYGNEWNFEALRDYQSLDQTSNATWIGSSSTSAHDLYPINLDSR